MKNTDICLKFYVTLRAGWWMEAGAGAWCNALVQYVVGRLCEKYGLFSQGRII